MVGFVHLIQPIDNKISLPSFDNIHNYAQLTGAPPFQAVRLLPILDVLPIHRPNAEWCEYGHTPPPPSLCSRPVCLSLALSCPALSLTSHRVLSFPSSVDDASFDSSGHSVSSHPPRFCPRPGLIGHSLLPASDSFSPASTNLHHITTALPPQILLAFSRIHCNHSSIIPINLLQLTSICCAVPH